MVKPALHGLLITGAIAIALSGCGHKPVSSGAEAVFPQAKPLTYHTNTTGPVSRLAQTAAVKEKNPVQRQIKVYYGDEQAEMLVEKEVVIDVTDEKDKYTTALWALKKAPENSGLVPLAEAIGFKSAVLIDHQLTLDVTVSGEGRLGARGEAMLLEAIRKTIFQFLEVDSLAILVDGSPAESLMGHMELSYPMPRESGSDYLMEV